MASVHSSKILLCDDFDDREPRIRDMDLGERLGYERPRAIRELIERLDRDGLLSNLKVCRTARQTSGGRPGMEYWLDERAALKVIARSETAIADALLDEVIDVFLAYRRGRLTPPVDMAAIGQIIASALAPVLDRLSALESRGVDPYITSQQRSQLSSHVRRVATFELMCGRWKNRRQANADIYSALRDECGWGGKGRPYHEMPAAQFPVAIAFLNGRSRDAERMVEALAAQRQTHFHDLDQKH